MSDTNLVYTSEDYKDYYQNLSMASENDSLKIWQHIQKNVNGLKDMKLESILDIYNDSENITYLGNNFWTYANNVDTTVKVYSTEKMDYPSFPYIALTAKLCLPTALADSNTRGDNINDMYSSFTDDDLYKAFDSTEIEFDKISTVESVKQVQNMPDNLTEVLCVFKNPDSYIKLYTSRSSNSGVYGYTYDKNEYNHETGFSNEENCYEYLRVGNDAYYRDNHADMYFKASEFKGKMVKDGESFRDFFIKNYKFSYSFNASVENTPYTIQVYNNGNSYITLVSNPNAKDKLKAWVSDDNGVIVVSDIFMSSDKNSDNVFAAISQSHSYAKEHIGSKKD